MQLREFPLKLQPIDESEYPSWRKGRATREKILKVLGENPEITEKDLAKKVGISLVQLRRQRRTLKAEGLWKVAIALTLLIPAAYYGEANSSKSVSIRVKSSTPFVEARSA
ncbi:MAG: winged helix-turn-helix domain-containing protein [Desertifilum sp.]|nr:winged helix-turn-helix domain-containing protein [Desertifilum sp.]